MRLGILFSGGKDSCLALHKAMQTAEVSCLITLESENPESYMFHTPNIHLARVQAKAMDLPIHVVHTKGKKEEELKDLEKAILKGIKEQGIQGIVTGAVDSVYQASRVQRICNRLGLWCFNPLWQMRPENLLYELLEHNFEVIVSGIAAYPLGREWLGRRLDKNTVKQLFKLKEEYGISPVGEGGEFETFVLNSPEFKKRIKIVSSETKYNNNVGRLIIKETVLE